MTNEKYSKSEGVRAAERKGLRLQNHKVNIWCYGPIQILHGILFCFLSLFLHLAVWVIFAGLPLGFDVLRLENCSTVFVSSEDHAGRR